MSELKILIHIGHHLNVVNLLGACTKPNGTDRGPGEAPRAGGWEDPAVSARLRGVTPAAPLCPPQAPSW